MPNLYDRGGSSFQSCAPAPRGCYAPVVVSRRRVLALPVVPALVAAGCGGSRSASLVPSATPVTVEPSASAAPAAPTPSPVPRGGVARLLSRRAFSFDTFDADLSGDATTVEVLGRTHSRLLNYRDFEAETFAPDLTIGWEQPELSIGIFHIDPTARWHDRAPGNGAQVTPAQVASSLSRTVSLALSPGQPAARRSHDWQPVQHAFAVGGTAVQLTLSRPDPFLLHTLAGRFAFVQHPGASESLGRTPLDAAGVVGSGPFSLEGEADTDLVFHAHADGHRPPRVDRLVLGPAGDAVGRFLAGSAHRVVVEDRRDVEAIEAATGGVPARERAPLDAPIMSTFNVGAPPWNDPRLIDAIHLAFDRAELATRLLGAAGRGAPMTFLLPHRSTASLGLAEADALAFEGPSGTDVRWREARARWTAAGGTALGPITIDFPSIFDPRYAASAVVPAMLNEALGVEQFRPAVESYTSISRKAANGAYGNGNAAFWFGWGPPFNDPSAARALFETYHSAAPTARSLGFANADVDAALEGLVAATEPGARAPFARRALSAIASSGLGGICPWLVEVHDSFRWPYFVPGGPEGWWSQHFDAGATVDTADPRYRA